MCISEVSVHGLQGANWWESFWVVAIFTFLLENSHIFDKFFMKNPCFFHTVYWCFDQCCCNIVLDIGLCIHEASVQHLQYENPWKSILVTIIFTFFFIEKALIIMHPLFYGPQAIETLKSFEKKDSKVASTAATNLSFLYFLVSKLITVL